MGSGRNSALSGPAWGLGSRYGAHSGVEPPHSDRLTHGVDLPPFGLRGQTSVGGVTYSMPVPACGMGWMVPVECAGEGGRAKIVGGVSVADGRLGQLTIFYNSGTVIFGGQCRCTCGGESARGARTRALFPRRCSVQMCMRDPSASLTLPSPEARGGEDSMTTHEDDGGGPPPPAHDACGAVLTDSGKHWPTLSGNGENRQTAVARLWPTLADTGRH